MDPNALSVTPADLRRPDHAAALVEIIDSYARGPGGQNAPLSPQARQDMAAGLLEQPHSLVLLAWDGEEGVGAAVCFFGFSTFAARPLLNLHDFAVRPEWRGRGVGSALLDAVEERARARGCCKITLEVHDTNDRAKALYERRGFGPWDAPTWSVSRPL